MKSSRGLLRTAVIVGAVAALVGCGGGRDGGEDKGDATGAQTLTVAIGVEPDTFDPMRQTTLTVQNIVDGVAETLTMIREDNSLEPLLATSWDVSPNGRAYTFKLREGVKFHDGTPFDGEAVKVNLDRVADPENTVPNRAILSVIDRTEVLGPHEVRVHLKSPAPSILAGLSNTPAAMISPASLEAEGNSYAEVKTPVGTGPYKMGEYVRGQHVTLARNDAYWGEKPPYSEHKFLIAPEATTRETLLKSGQADVLVLPPLSDLKALEADDRYTVINAPTNGVAYLVINTTSRTQKLLGDPRVRQALNQGVDRQALIDTTLFGAGKVPDAPIAPTLPGYCPADAYEYDPEKAKSLLSEAGADGMTVEVMSPTGRYPQDSQVATAVVGYLRDLGLKVNGPQTMDWPSYVETLLAEPGKTEAELSFMIWTPAYPSAEASMSIFHSKTIAPAGFNSAHYSNPEVDDLLDKANAELDDAAREETYCEAATKVWSDAPLLWLYVATFPVVHDKSVEGVAVLPTAKFSLRGARPAG